MSALVARGLAAAAVAGLLFALSPLTVVLGLVIAALIGWACAARDPLERRWLVALLVGAVFVRAAAIAYLALTTDLARESFHTTFGDGQYALERSLWIRNTLLGIGVAPLDYAEAFKEYGRSGYHYPLAWLQVAFGPSPYGIHVLSVALYVGGAIVLFREARSSFGAATAFLGLALILCLPTLLLWSISPLKESLFFSLSSVVVVAARRGIGALQRRQPALAVASAIVVASTLWAVASLRAGGLVIALGGLLVGVALAAIFQHRRLVLFAVVTIPVLVALLLSQPRVQNLVMSQVRDAAQVHVGHVQTAGAAYKLLPLEFYLLNRPMTSLTGPDVVRYAASAVQHFVLTPEPWAPVTRTDVFMIPQQMIWYLLVICAVPGVVAGLRRDPTLTCLLMATVLVGMAVIAPASGNVGTLLRHRDMIVPFVVWIAALGGVVTLGSCANYMRKEG